MCEGEERDGETTLCVHSFFLLTGVLLTIALLEEELELRALPDRVPRSFLAL